MVCGACLRRSPHQYVVMLMGGVVDGNYQGRIKAIMANNGWEMVVILRHATFCQGVLLPTISSPMVLRDVKCLPCMGSEEPMGE